MCNFFYLFFPLSLVIFLSTFVIFKAYLTRADFPADFTSKKTYLTHVNVGFYYNNLHKNTCLLWYLQVATSIVNLLRDSFCQLRWKDKIGRNEICMHAAIVTDWRGTCWKQRFCPGPFLWTPSKTEHTLNACGAHCPRQIQGCPWLAFNQRYVGRGGLDFYPFLRPKIFLPIHLHHFCHVVFAFSIDLSRKTNKSFKRSK